MGRPAVEYLIIPDYTQMGPCIYKLSYNRKFIFVKCKNNLQSSKAVQKLLRQFLEGSKSARDKGGLYFHFFSYIEKNPGFKIKLTVVFSTDNLYELLVEEQLRLNKYRKDPDCLNNQVEVYIPLYNDLTGHYGWIDRGAVLNFKKWMKANKRKKKAL